MAISFKKKKSDTASALVGFVIPEMLENIEDKTDRHEWYRRLFGFNRAISFAKIVLGNGSDGGELVMILDKDKSEVDKNTKVDYVNEDKSFKMPIYVLGHLPVDHIREETEKLLKNLEEQKKPS